VNGKFGDGPTALERKQKNRKDHALVIYADKGRVYREGQREVGFTIFWRNSGVE